jgi:hypothetical protein
MALIELTAAELCAAQSFPFPCEEGSIIDPIGVAHQLGFVETGAAIFEDAGNGFVPKGGRKADERLALLSLACSMEASQAVTRGRTANLDAEKGEPERADVKDALEAFTNGVIASPPELSTEFPPAGTVIVVGTIIIKIPTPPPPPPRWELGEQLARTDLLALAVRFESASKMADIGATADDLAWAANRLIDAAMAR